METFAKKAAARHAQKPPGGVVTNITREGVLLVAQQWFRRMNARA
ncbi:hypothetical protein [Prosthecobacter sp.]